jgi:hypothetical protein
MLTKTHAITEHRMIKRTYALALLLATLSGCKDTDTVKHSLNGRGYSSVQLTGYTIKGCGVAIGFKAVDRTDHHVVGHVCAELRTKINSVELNSDEEDAGT